MYLEIGKQYIVDVTDKGIIPIDEFSGERFFDKDNDDLEFLTDEEKAEIVNKVLNDIKVEIEKLRLHSSRFITSDGRVCVDSQDVLEILDSIEGERIDAL